MLQNTKLRIPTNLAISSQMMQEAEQWLYQKALLNWQNQTQNDKKRGRKKRHTTVKAEKLKHQFVFYRGSGLQLMVTERALLELLNHRDVRGHDRTGQTIIKYFNRVLNGLIWAAQHDHKYQLFETLGQLALVGTKEADGKRLTRGMRRLMQIIGVHVDNPRLAKLLQRLVLFMTKVDFVLAGKHRGKLVDVSNQLQYLTGEQLNRGCEGEAVRGGLWFVAQVNPELMKACNTRFMELDPRAFQLNTSAFNIYLNLNASRHYKYNKDTKSLPEAIFVNAKEITQRSGIAQLTQRTIYREMSTLKKALDAMVELGILRSWRLHERQLNNLEVVFAPPDT